MPNGDSKNWDRVCVAIDQFRSRHGRWPQQVRMWTPCYLDLITHVLTPLGFALVSSVVELVADEDEEIGVTADDRSVAEGAPSGLEIPIDAEVETPAHVWFGRAIFRPGLES